MMVHNTPCHFLCFEFWDQTPGVLLLAERLQAHITVHTLRSELEIDIAAAAPPPKKNNPNTPQEGELPAVIADVAFIICLS